MREVHHEPDVDSLLEDAVRTKQQLDTERWRKELRPRAMRLFAAHRKRHDPLADALGASEPAARQQLEAVVAAVPPKVVGTSMIIVEGAQPRWNAASSASSAPIPSSPGVHPTASVGL